LRGAESIAELCRREAIAERLYYAWSNQRLGSVHRAGRGAPPGRRYRPRRHNRRVQGTAAARMACSAARRAEPSSMPLSASRTTRPD
jgi:hypothetical protein